MSTKRLLHRRSKQSSRQRWIWASLAASVFSFSSAQAQTNTWNNYQGTGATVPMWSVNSNWTSSPTFGNNAIVQFGASGLQTSGLYSSGVDGDYTMNSLRFSTDGGYQGANAGLPLVLNLGDSANILTGTLRLNTSSGSVAPSIVQNGSGSVLIQTTFAGSSIAIEGANAVNIGGTGVGLVEINSNIVAGGTSGPNSGLVFDFNPSAVHVNNTGASVVLAGTNSFTGDVILKNGNLSIASATALGAATNKLIVQPGSNSLRFNNTSNLTIANQVQLNAPLTIVSYDGAASTLNWTGSWTGNNSVTFRPGIGHTFGFQGNAGFTGSLILKPLTNGIGGTANANTVNISSTTGGASNGVLSTTDIQLFAGSVMNLNNTNANATRLAPGTNLTMNRSEFNLLANATVNAAETVSSLTNTGMSSFTVTPGASSSATMTFTNWNRLSNSTAYFVATGLGNAPASTVGNIVITNNPGGATPGSTTPGTQNLAVLPYAFGNTASTGNWSTSLVRYDSSNGRITPLNYNTEYSNNIAFAYGLGASGSNYRLVGSNTGGVASMSGNVSLNGLVLDSNFATTPSVGVSIRGNSTINMTGPVLSTFSGTSFPTGINTFLPNQIAVNQLAFGSNTAYFHTPGDLWVLNPITGTGGLVKSGYTNSTQANLLLFGNNSGLSGGLTVNSGNVYFDADNNLGAAGGSILLNAGSAGGLVYAPNLHYGTSTATGLTINRPMTLGTANGGIAVLNFNSTLTYSGVITGGGGLAKAGNGNLVLSNASNTFAGDIGLYTGTLIAASDAALGNAGNNIVMGVPLGQAVFQPGTGYSSTNRNFIILNSGNTINTDNANFTINGELVSTQTANTGPGITKGGLGTLTLTATNTLGGTLTIGNTGTRLSVPNQAQIGGAVQLSGPNGSLALLSAVTLNDNAGLILDNTTGVNNDRIGTVNINMGGRSFLELRGNSSADTTERVGSIGGAGVITLVQPTSGGSGQVTTLNATGLSGSFSGVLFVRGTNLGASSGDRTQMIVTPVNTTSTLPLSNGIVVGGVSAASATSSPTDFLAATQIAVSPPNVNQYSLAPLTTYGSLSSPGATVNANQAGSVFTLGGATDLSALRIGAAGGVDLNGQILTLGTATSNARSGMILAAGGANQGIVGGTIAYGSQAAVFVTTDHLSVGSAGSPTALTGTGALYKSGPGNLTLFGTGSTTIGTSGGVIVNEGSLILGNTSALGVSTTNLLTGVMPSVTVNKAGTLDLTSLGTSNLRINSLFGAGNIQLGDVKLNNGASSSSLQGNITGSANSIFIVGASQADAPLNTFGGGGPNMSGDNSGFLGQWQVLRGTLRFSSNLSFGTGTSPILFSDSATATSTGTVTINIDQTLTVPFPRDISVPAGGFALPTLLVGNSSNLSMTGNLSLGKAMGISGSVGGNGMFMINGNISGAGQLQLGTSVFSGSGNIGIASANPGWSGGVLLNTGLGSSAVSGVVAIGADNSLGTGTITVSNFAGLLRGDNGARTLANNIDVAPASPFTANFGTTGVNDITFNGNVKGAVASATGSSTTLALNSISLGNTTFNGTISNGSAPNLGITKNGPGVVALNGNNTFTGNTVLNGGTTILGNTNALGYGGRQAATGIAGNTTVASGAVLDLNGQGNVNKAFVLSGGSLMNNSGTPASISGGTVSSLTMTANGGALSSAPTVTLTGGGGSGATAQATLGVTTASFAVATGGTGYFAVPSVSITGGGGSGAQAVATLGVTAQSFTITNGGVYAGTPTVSIGGGGGSGATATAIMSGGSVIGVTITSPGNNFLFTPTISFSGGTPTVAATAVGNAQNFQVRTVSVTDWGSGYTSAPTMTFSGGTTGSVATASSNASNFALGLAVTNPGTGYTSAPTVNFSSGTATATANLSGVSVTANSVAGGSGDLAINAPLSGSANINKVGAGKLSLNGNSSGFTGTVTINQGTLGGTGTLGGAVATASSSAVIAPGNSTGIFRAASLDTTLGGTFSAEINGAPLGSPPVPGTDYDQLNISGTALLGNLMQLQVLAPLSVGAGGQTFVIMVRGAGSSGQFAGLNEGDTIFSGPNTFRISYAGLDYNSGGLAPGADGNDIVLSAVPEPVTVALIGLLGVGAAGGVYYRRRRMQKAWDAPVR